MQSYIKRFMPLWDDWNLNKYIGSGSFGNVWQVVNSAGDEAAIKEIIVPHESAGTIYSACLQGLDPENARIYFSETLNQAIFESKMQCGLSDCENIVKFQNYTVKELNGKDEFGWVLFILMDKVQVFTEYQIKNGISVLDLIKLGVNICDALERCKKEKIIHQDIKPENIFYSSINNYFQLGDFGIARYVVRETENKGRVGTMTHMSPNVYYGKDYGYEDDLYALAMVIYKILNFNRVPFLPDYPAQYLPPDRESALVRRLKGEKLPNPAILRCDRNNIEYINSIRAGIRIESDDWERVTILSDIVVKALSPEIEDRYNDVSEFRKSIQYLL